MSTGYYSQVIFKVPSFFRLSDCSVLQGALRDHQCCNDRSYGLRVRSKNDEKYPPLFYLI
ncbi:hypothetical protein CI789_15995 [Erwinia persicina]|uniref:Uncharacterized protein n=1 Tax=Erwinia persicina TaxID=55211 RepID=A0A354AJI1_9GAMM|nr:hypothetical protein CI789_15995 [Erwinia persicina]TKJ90864.1 hypothetical protein EpCFBP13511_10285 [Erwinia persicina]HBH67668.1 hypothetical protein [Erwinia persicina]HBI07301.1 hypothetical protein [Erwinia persicina]HBT15044.1 hypothetical protein [Erwinia persicina]